MVHVIRGQSPTEHYRLMTGRRVQLDRTIEHMLGEVSALANVPVE
jgi:hypothetical protein